MKKSKMTNMNDNQKKGIFFKIILVTGLLFRTYFWQVLTDFTQITSNET